MAFYPKLVSSKPEGQRGEGFVARHRALRREAAGNNLMMPSQRGFEMLRPTSPHKSLKKSSRREMLGLKTQQVKGGKIGGFTGAATVEAKELSPNTPDYARRLAGARARVEDHAASGLRTDALIAAGTDEFQTPRPNAQNQRVSGVRQPPGSFVHPSTLIPVGLVAVESRQYFGFPESSTRFY